MLGKASGGVCSCLQVESSEASSECFSDQSYTTPAFSACYIQYVLIMLCRAGHRALSLPPMQASYQC